jgi:ABC-type transport system involved in multi-copper enzyme maturation permease subunit
MSDAVFQRLIWKEYRVQRGFWLSMAGFAVVCQIIVLLLPEQTVSHASWLFGLALGIPAFYALGCGATLFAAEREEGTLEQLRVLAAPGWKVWWSKLGFSVASTASLLALLWVLAFNLSHGNTRDVGAQGALWAFWGVMTVEFLAWGIFFSLLTKRPLNAACMAAVASLVSASIVSSIAINYRSMLVPNDSAVFGCILQVLGLFALDVWIALRWVLDRPGRRSPEGAETEEQAALRLFAYRVALSIIATFVAIVFVPATINSLNWWSPVLPSSWPVVWGVALAEAIAWGTYFSLRVRRPIIAASLAAVVGFVICQIFLAIVTISGSRPLLNLAPWVSAVLMRMFVVLIVLVLDIWIALRWRATLGVAERAERKSVPARSVSLMRALVWQEGRQAWRTITIFWGVAIALLVFYRMFDPVRDDVSFGTAVAVAGVFASLMGSCAFLAEQEGHNFRFFANRGVAARQVWFSKQLVWLPVALVTASAFCWISSISLRHGSHVGAFEDLWEMALLLVIAYCSGQFASMLLTRGLVAGFLGLVLSLFLFLWLLLMLRLGMSLWWSAVPIPLVLLLATWLRAPAWMLEQSSWRPRLRFLGLLLIPLIGLPAAVAAHRVYEIPGTGPGFSPEQVLRAVTREEAETAAMYRHAIAVLVPMRPGAAALMTDEETRSVADRFAAHGWEQATPAERAWLEVNRAPLDITLQAALRPSCVFYDPRERRNDTATGELLPSFELAELLLLEARRLESDGDLAEALDCYVATIRLGYHVQAAGTLFQFRLGDVCEALVCQRMPRWAAHPGQTPERMRQAISRLDDVFRSAPPLSDSLKIDYLMIRRALQKDFDEVAGERETDNGLSILMRGLMPWEYARAFRLLDYRTGETLQYVSEVNAALSSGRPPSPWRPTGRAGYDQQTGNDKWAQMTLLPSKWAEPDSWGELAIRAETRRRALRVILALKAWQHVHGDLPKTLDVLVGDYFERLPLDPQSARPFGYAPRGFESLDRTGPLQQLKDKPGQPLLWSSPTGSSVRSIGTGEDGYPRFGISVGTPQVYPIP